MGPNFILQFSRVLLADKVATVVYRLGIPSRLVIFPDENHWVLNHGNSLKWHYEVLRWFDQFVGKADGH